MKKLFSALLALALLAALSMGALALEPSHLTDEAGLLTESQAAALLDKLDSAASRTGFHTVVAAVRDTGGLSAQDYAVQFYQTGFGPDGVMLLLDMGSRSWAIEAFGSGTKAIGRDARKLLSDTVQQPLADGDYSAAFTAFADTVQSLLQQAESGHPYKAPFKWGKTLIIAAIVSFLIALIATGVMKGSLRSVAKKSSAADYVRKDTLKLREQKELYLYHKVESRKLQKSEPGTAGTAGKF